MSLERKQGSKWWYGRFFHAGKRRLVNLKVAVKGCPPQKGETFGDPLYERSKAEAQVALSKLVDDVKKRGNELQLLEKVHELKTGRKFEVIPLAEMASQYLTVEREKPLNEQWAKQLVSIAADFALFCRAWSTSITDMGGVTGTVAMEYAKIERQQGYVPKTYNNRIGALSSMFEALGLRVGVPLNPFAGVAKLSTATSTVHRRPFSVEEIEKILAVAKGDEFARPIIVTALSTAMRRRDCCLLTFADVDWPKRVIRVKPAKDGERVGIPIFPILETILYPIMEGPAGKPSDYVFPKQASRFLINPDGITDCVHAVLRKVGFTDASDDESISLTKARTVGKRRASLRGTHSFRTTWITLALMHGMSVEEVQMITGHKTVEVVLKYYFNPSDEQRRQSILAKLPAVLTGKVYLETGSTKVDGLVSSIGELTPEEKSELLKRIQGGK